MKVNNQSLLDQYSVLYQNRHCYQEDVDIIIFKRNSGYADRLLKFKGMNFSAFKPIQFLKPKRHFGKAVIGQHIYSVSESNSSEDLSIVETYSMKSDNWKNTTQLQDMRYDFCVCSFKQNLFIIGGNYKHENYLNTCLKYDVKINKWCSIANMNERRSELACSVFHGKVVISGGFSYTNWRDYGSLKSVESYDYHEDKWIFLPDMIFERCGHAAVSMGNKMFIIGGFDEGIYTLPCEVFDKFSNKFSCIESPLRIQDVIEQPYCVGNKIVIITDWHENTTWFNVYDVDQNSWSGKNSCVNN